MKMTNPELEVVRFGAEDVIATSGCTIPTYFLLSDIKEPNNGRIYVTAEHYEDGLYSFSDATSYFKVDNNGNIQPLANYPSYTMFYNGGIAPIAVTKADGVKAGRYDWNGSQYVFCTKSH